MSWKIENKSIGKGKGVQFSSIAAWSKDKLPKYLIVWKLNKKMAKIPGRNGRDLEVKIENFYIYFIADEKLIVPWVKEPSHDSITKTKLESEDNPMFEKLNEIAKRQNSLHPDALIRLQETSFKNGNFLNGTFRIQCEVKDHRKLPAVPDYIRNTMEHNNLVKTCKSMIGARLRIKKYDKPLLRGKRVWATESILQMEHEQKTILDEKGLKNSSKLSKDQGELYYCNSENEINLSGTQFGQNFSAREDYWSGNAIDVLMAYLNSGLKQTPSKTIGADLLLSELEQNSELKHEEKLAISEKIGKQQLLREIQYKLDIRPRKEDVSRGGTVTRSGLLSIAESLAERMGKPSPQLATKSMAIEFSLRILGENLTDLDVSKGGTITAYALYRIYRNL